MSDGRQNKLVILDRDGVINVDSDDYIKSVDEWLPIPGSIEAIARLSRAGYQVAVATNQSGLARGYFDEVALANMHNYMYALVEEQGGRIDTVCFCPHGPDAGCDCRKPRPGLLEQIAEQLDMPVAGAWYVGDTEKDMHLAMSKQCRPILVRTGKGTAYERSLPAGQASRLVIADDLAGAADYILATDRGSSTS